MQCGQEGWAVSEEVRELERREVDEGGVGEGSGEARMGGAIGGGWMFGTGGGGGVVGGGTDCAIVDVWWRAEMRLLEALVSDILVWSLSQSWLGRLGGCGG